MINLPGNSRTTYLFTAFISSVIFIVLLLLLPKIEKYRVTIDSEQYIGQEMYHYSDLDSDGESELVRFNKNFSGVAAFIVEKKGKILYQHNFEDQYINSDLFYFTGDYNLDKLEEIYVLTTSNDSIFLNVIEGISEHIILNRTFLTQFHYHANLPDYGVMHLELSDFTGSSRKDLFIGFGCGFSYKTRKCAIYNIDENKLVVSEPTGASLQSAISFYDISDNGKKEIFGNINSYGNAPENYFLTDEYLWFFVYQSTLEFLFPPKKTGLYPGWIKTRPFIQNGEKRIVAFKSHHGNKNDTPFIGIYDLKGHLIQSKTIAFDENLTSSIFKTFPPKKPNQILLLKTDGKVQEFDENLTLVREKQLMPFSSILFSFDIDEDGEKELFLLSNDDLLIVSGDFQYVNKVPGISPSKLFPNSSLLKRHGKKPVPVLKEGDKIYHLNYRKNFLFQYRFIYYPGIWLLIFVIVFATGLVFQKIAVEKEESEKRLAALQLKAIENQLNPHFNFNILNSIAALYENNSIEKGKFYIAKYSKLLRNLLMQSGKVTIPIEEELEFTKTYLDLEKLRMNDKFEYLIKGENEFLDVEIPKMLIHTFCENSLRHGIRYLKEKGRLSIHFKKEKEVLKIIISDNGIGREKAMQYSSMSTGKGLKIVKKSLKLHFQLKHVKINYNISDIYDKHNNVAGTKVEITIPVF